MKTYPPSTISVKNMPFIRRKRIIMRHIALFRGICKVHYSEFCTLKIILRGIFRHTGGSRKAGVSS